MSTKENVSQTNITQIKVNRFIKQIKKFIK